MFAVSDTSTEKLLRGAMEIGSVATSVLVRGSHGFAQ